jgi:exosome complex component RRP43
MVPSSEAPADGQLVVSVEMTALSSPSYRPGRAPSITHVIQQRLTEVLVGCGVLKLSDLCIGEGQAVWVVYLDLYILNAAGSLLDAALLAAVAALQDTKLPAVHLTEEGNVERDEQQAADDNANSSSSGSGWGPSSSSRAGPSWMPLQLHDTPLCLTCGVYQGQLIADPDHEEEALMTASISVILGRKQELLGEPQDYSS